MRQYTLSDFNFNLPEELIAQRPSDVRAGSRLMVLERSSGAIQHSQFCRITDYFKEGDLLVFNNARVINARLFFRRETGARVEIILTKRISDYEWEIITNRTARLRVGESLKSDVVPDIALIIKERKDEKFIISTKTALNEEVLKKIGSVPLPPYIKRDTTEEDSDRYQTVYATVPGAVAAPTAGLHFTDDILHNIREKSVETLFLTLNVSWGTFQPVRQEDLAIHKMHTESYNLSCDTAERINSARREGRRIVAVGTTSLRVLEATFDGKNNVPGEGETDIFIYPPRRVESINALITNFHTPYSTLLMLVSAFAGYDAIMDAYKEAVNEKYRFFSYGDSMLIL